MIATEEAPAAPLTVQLALSQHEASLLLDSDVVRADGVNHAVTDIVKRALYKSLKAERPLGAALGDPARAADRALRQLRVALYVQRYGPPQEASDKRALGAQLGVSRRTLNRDLDLALAMLSHQVTGVPAVIPKASQRTLRQLRLVQYVEKNGPVQGEYQKRDLATQLGVSQRTLYRDLDTIAAWMRDGEDLTPASLHEPRAWTATADGLRWEPPSRRSQAPDLAAGVPKLRAVRVRDVRPGRPPKKRRRARSTPGSLTPDGAQSPGVAPRTG